MATFQEPNDTPSPMVPLDSGTGGGWAIQVDFAPESHSRGAITYWVTGDEDVVADVQLARGTGVANDPWSVAMIVVIDGQQVSVLNAAMQSTSTLRYQIAAGQVIHDRLTLKGTTLKNGAQSAAILAMGPKGELLPGWSFTILKNGTAFAPRQSADATREPAHANGGPTAIITGGTDFFNGRATLSSGGTLPVQFIMQTIGDCPTIPRGRRIIAVLDGVQIPVGALGLAPWVSVTPPERAELTTQFTALPDDGLLHALTLWATSDGEYMEGPRGQVAPWAIFPVMMGRAWWPSQ